MPEVSVIIVCMNRPDILFPCIDSILVQNSLPLELLVVAYRFSPDNLAALRERFPSVKVILSDETRGFSENNNLALQQAKGKYCFIVNDDTLQAMPVIDALASDFSRLGDDAAAVSPCIRFTDGSVQTCGRAPWNARRYMKHYLHRVDETKPSPWSMQEGLFRTWTLNGACFLIRTEIFREAGFFDERFFFTPEDIALGQKLNEMGYTVWADADISITHLAGGSVSAMEPAIKPARVSGALLYYGHRLSLGFFIWCFEALRFLKYLFLPRTEYNRMMRQTARNVMGTVFSRRSPKETFIRYAR